MQDNLKDEYRVYFDHWRSPDEYEQVREEIVEYRSEACAWGFNIMLESREDMFRYRLRWSVEMVECDSYVFTTS